MKVDFKFKVNAKSFPAICFVGGLVLFIGSFLGLGFWAGLFGVILIFVAIVLYVWNRSQRY
jgi:Flp pilus assembly protein TadB